MVMVQPLEVEVYSLSPPPSPPQLPQLQAHHKTSTTTHPAQQRQMLLVEAYEQEQRERAKVNNESKTLQLLTQQRQKIPKELAPLYSDSVSVDTEWVDERNKTDE